MTLSTSLTNTIVNRHLLSNLSAINVRMEQIPFTVKYDIKENNNYCYYFNPVNSV